MRTILKFPSRTSFYILLQIGICVLGITFIIRYFYLGTPLTVKLSPDDATIVELAPKRMSPMEDKLRTKVILYWNTFYDLPDFGVGYGNIPFKNCPVSNCMTSDRTQFNASDAIIFHPRDFNMEDLPSFRLPQQRWVWYDHESPKFCRRFKYDAHFFNWTMTYRLDSEIVCTYGHTVPFAAQANLNTEGRNETTWIDDIYEYRRLKESSTAKTTEVRFDINSFVKAKNKSIAWLVSHCKTQSQRENYVRELSKYIDVDIYGRCTNLTCPNNCLQSLGRQYKFYLAFENSLCVDYVTEKFFKSLNHGMVPIVFGLEIHKTLGPPNSFIDADMFESPQDLAEFLHNLMENDLNYMKYLEWNQAWKTIPHRGWCNLCQALNDPHLSLKKTSYEDIDDWFFHADFCFQPKFKARN